MLRDEYLPLLKQVVKPGRYTGGEFGELKKDKENLALRFCFCFPDTYEIGMSNLGVRILADVMNRREDIWCERSFAPWEDYEKLLRENGLPIYALESGDPLGEFDIVGFTLQYELCYTNVLNMLDISGIPAYSKDRGDDYPVIIGGGPCTYNPEPVSDFFDLFSIGEGEEALLEVCDLLIESKKAGRTKKEFLRLASHIEGIYVPSLYDVQYKTDGNIKSIDPLFADVPAVITKRIIKDLDTAPFPEEFAVPYIETIHDRVNIEVFRGCIRGCRFCQAGIVYRPYREKSPEIINGCAERSINSTGYDEISLTSLSISDYSEIDRLLEMLLEWTDEKKINISLPSMRIDAFYEKLYKKVMSVRKSGLTFAPEAGTQRLRDVINKNITENDIFTACRTAFENGRTSLKLYFMNGLPTETEDDIKGIAALAQDIVNVFYEEKRNGRNFNVGISVSCFIPKPFTPFQWEPQDDLASLEEKQKLLKDEIKTKKISYKYHNAKVSRLEAVFARGDRRLAPAILEAVRQGQVFDSWDEYFNYDKWMSIFEKCSIDPGFYANRRIPFGEILPWDHISCGVEKEFLVREAKKALNGETTPDCRTACSGCGANSLGGERSCCP